MVFWHPLRVFLLLAKHRCLTCAIKCIHTDQVSFEHKAKLRYAVAIWFKSMPNIYIYVHNYAIKEKAAAMQ